MAKFYVQSGSVRLIVDAADARRAALWTVHRTLESVLPEGENDMHLEDLTHPEPIGGMVLGDTIRLSEKGFRQSEAAEFDTLDIVSEWSQLMMALSRMEQDLKAA